MSAALETSQLMAAILRPGAPAWILALASARVPWSRARIVTSAPDLAYSSAIARPSPLLPPVTTALRPFNLMSIPGLLSQGCDRDLMGRRSISRLSTSVNPQPDFAGFSVFAGCCTDDQPCAKPQWCHPIQPRSVGVA